jgi:hypothetical protein
MKMQRRGSMSPKEWKRCAAWLAVGALIAAALWLAYSRFVGAGREKLAMAADATAYAASQPPAYLAFVHGTAAAATASDKQAAAEAAASWTSFAAQFGGQLSRAGVGLREFDMDAAGGVPAPIRRYVRAAPDVLFVDHAGGDGLRVVNFKDVEGDAAITVSTLMDFLRQNGWGPNDAIGA